MTNTTIRYGRLNPPERTLLSPDLSNPSPRARQGLIGILEGAADPSFLKVMDEALALLRFLWGTENPDTFLIPGSEETALEAALFNVLEPRDTAVVVVNGFFGERMAQAAERAGAKVVRVAGEPGKAVSEEAIEHTLRQNSARLLAVLHGDGSTGVEQPVGSLGVLAHDYNALLLVDTRWTLGALDTPLDRWGVDIAVAGSQKALSAYPGLGLITFSPRAAEIVARRRFPVSSWSLDLGNLRQFRTDERAAQTLPAPILYALTEMLQLAYEQGIAYRIQRHINRRDALVTGLEALGLTIYADQACRLPTVTAVNVPEGVDAERVRDKLRTPYRLDIGGGLGDLRGKIWRIGIMSHSAQPTFLASLLTLLETVLQEEGYPIREQGAATRALLAHLDP
jgi:alanine-glyoxylate transaminase / serine-glyoxylate transaminase / serine-pyruvate transaminase